MDVHARYQAMEILDELQHDISGERAGRAIGGEGGLVIGVDATHYADGESGREALHAVTVSTIHLFIHLF